MAQPLIERAIFLQKNQQQLAKSRCWFSFIMTDFFLSLFLHRLCVGKQISACGSERTHRAPSCLVQRHNPLIDTENNSNPRLICCFQRVLVKVSDQRRNRHVKTLRPFCDADNHFSAKALHVKFPFSGNDQICIFGYFFKLYEIENNFNSGI